MVRRALEERGETLDEGVADFFTRWRRTHNDAVFSAYTPEMRAVRKNHLVTGLPDTYGEVESCQTTAAWLCTASTFSFDANVQTSRTSGSRRGPVLDV